MPAYRCWGALGRADFKRCTRSEWRARTVCRMDGALRACAVLRWSRAAVLAGVALAFAAVSHAGAGGQLPGPAGLTVLAVVTTAVLASLLGRPASTLRVAMLLACGQATLHGLFTAAGGHPGALSADRQAGGGDAAFPDGQFALPRGGISDALGTDKMLAINPPGPGPLGHWMAHLQTDLSTPANQRMALAHLIAAAALGVWLAAGERLMWRLVLLLAGPTTAALNAAAELVARIIATRLTSPIPPATPRSTGWPCLFTPPPVHTLLLAQVVMRRGPPATVVG
jgi:hypothetical protein